MTVTITRERPDTADAQAMYDEAERYYDSIYGGYDNYGQNAEDLIAEDIAFYVLREDGVAAACGGVVFVDDSYAELKRIYARPAFRGKGYGRALMEHIETYVREQGYRTIRLETGSRQPEALAMYERMGYERIPPFGDYPDDELSVHMEKNLKEGLF